MLADGVLLGGKWGDNSLGTCQYRDQHSGCPASVPNLAQLQRLCPGATQGLAAYDGPQCSCHALRRAGGLWMRVKKARCAGGEAQLLITSYAFAAKHPNAQCPNAPHQQQSNGLPELIVMVACPCR